MRNACVPLPMHPFTQAQETNPDKCGELYVLFVQALTSLFGPASTLSGHAAFHPWVLQLFRVLVQMAVRDEFSKPSRSLLACQSRASLLLPNSAPDPRMKLIFCALVQQTSVSTVWASFTAATADESVMRTFALLAGEEPLSHAALTTRVGVQVPRPCHYWAAVSPQARWLRGWCRCGGPVAAQQILVLSLRTRFLHLLWRRASDATAGPMTPAATVQEWVVIPTMHLRVLGRCHAISCLCEVCTNTGIFDESVFL